MEPESFFAPAPESIWEQLGPTVRETVIVDQASFLIDHPESTDHLLLHPAVRSAFARDEYMPYWTDLWPGARMLAKALMRESWPGGVEGMEGIEAWEIGCGLGLPGIVALSKGMRVTFTDYDACALRFAEANARLNGFDNFDTRQVDWRSPPDVQVRLLLGSDLIYEIRNVEPLIGFVKHTLHPQGQFLLTDQDRAPAHLLRDTLENAGLTFTSQIVRAGEPNGRRHKGTLYRIVWKDPNLMNSE